MKALDLINTSVAKAAMIRRNLSSAEPARITDAVDLFGPGGKPAEKDWTVLVYMEGRHRLAHSTDLALNKLEQLGSTDRVNLVVQATQAPEWQELTLANMKDLPTRRYYVTRDQLPDQVTSPVIEEMSQQIELTSQSLADFVAWGIDKFPAKNYMVIVKKHGAGFAGVSRGQGDDKVRLVPLSASECAHGLQAAEERTGRKINVLSFDSCSMQQVETAYQLRQHADVVMGSEDDVLAVAYPYGTAMAALNKVAGKATPQQVGYALVENYSQRVHSGIQSAIDTAALSRLGQQVHGLVDEAIQCQVNPSLLYTSMMDTAPMERNETSNLTFNFRDLGSFLERVCFDERYPESVRQAASKARLALEESVIARYSSDDRKALRQPTGMSAHLPWKAMDSEFKQAYQQLDWVQESGWGKLLDYVLESPPVAPQKGAAEVHSGGGLGQDFGKWGLFQYKKYISPYLNVTCSYTPTCSQFAREAIEKYGLWEGGKIGALRFFSCTGELQGDDPVAGGHVGHDHAVAGPVASQTLRTRLGEMLICPPPAHAVASGAQTWIARSRGLGMAVGAVGLAAVSLPVGAAVGAYIGWKSGKDEIYQHMLGNLQRYNQSVVHGFKNIAEPVGGPALKFHDWLEEKTGSDQLARAVAGPVGALTGLVLGAAGAAWQGARWGQLFGGLWTENRVKEILGELPSDPQTEAILRQDYGGRPSA